MALKINAAESCKSQRSWAVLSCIEQLPGLFDRVDEVRIAEPLQSDKADVSPEKVTESIFEFYEA